MSAQVTVADIDRWNTQLVDQVFDTCEQQAKDCRTLGEQLQSPSLFASWGGDAADAARGYSSKIRKDLDAHGREIQAVAVAARDASEGVSAVKAKLADLRAAIAGTGGALALAADPDRIENVSKSAGIVGPSTYDVLQVQLTEQLRQILFDAEKVDAELTKAIQTASGQIAPQGMVDANTSPPAESPDHLPGVPAPTSAPPGVPSMGPLGGTQRILPVVVPKDFSDPTMTSDIAKKYAVPLKLDPNKPGYTGPYSGNLLKGNPLDPMAPKAEISVPGSVDSAGKPKSLDINASRGYKLRVVGATPSSVSVAEYQGQPHLAVNYDYKYEISTTTSGQDYALVSPESWKAISLDQIEELQKLNGGKPAVPNPR